MSIKLILEISRDFFDNIYFQIDDNDEENSNINFSDETIINILNISKYSLLLGKLIYELTYELTEQNEIY